MTDIVERLRNWEQVDIVDAHDDGALYNAAADEIERLRDAISAAIKEARLPHYNDSFLQIGHFVGAIEILEKVLEQ